MKRQAAILLALSLGSLPAGAASGPPAARPAQWATAVGGTSVGNLYRIEEGLYRGAQPDAAGFRELAGLGVRAVLDLAGRGDERFVPDDSMKLFHVPMSAWGLHDDLVLKALRIMVDPRNRPLMVHCRHGADRTGAMVALYRVVVQGWTREQAVREMDDGGYHHSWLWRDLDRYVMKADIEKLREELGLSVSASSTSSPPAPAALAGPAGAAAASPR
jgi:protein tyrosine phosphatase (PTP) superfamily phosphohydrolase (DUF442 family)